VIGVIEAIFLWFDALKGMLSVTDKWKKIGSARITLACGSQVGQNTPYISFWLPVIN
jgi:hypothetical protein